MFMPLQQPMKCASVLSYSNIKDKWASSIDDIGDTLESNLGRGRRWLLPDTIWHVGCWCWDSFFFLLPVAEAETILVLCWCIKGILRNDFYWPQSVTIIPFHPYFCCPCTFSILLPTQTLKWGYWSCCSQLNPAKEGAQPAPEPDSFLAKENW